MKELPATEPAAPAPSLADSSSQSQQTQLALIDVPASQPYSSQPYVRPVAAPVRKAAPAAKPVAAPAKAGTHLVQLGSFSTGSGSAVHERPSRATSLNEVSAGLDLKHDPSQGDPRLPEIARQVDVRVGASGAAKEGRGSHFYFEENVIYSYGPHFPIARIVSLPAGGEGVLFTSRT